MRVAAIILQPDINRNANKRGGCFTTARQSGTDLQHIALTRGEIYPNRIELDDGGKHRGRRTGADELADRDLTGGNDAVEWRGHVGITEIDLSLLLVGLRRLQISLRRIALCQGLIIIRLGRDLSTDEIGLALVLGLRLRQRGLRAGHGSFCCIHLKLVRVRLDREEPSALSCKIALGVIACLETTLYARQ